MTKKEEKLKLLHELDQELVKEAQELGYAEPDPTNDVEGIDAKYKAIILSMICFGATPVADAVFTKGISDITKEDFSWAKRLGKTIKLVAVVENEEQCGSKYMKDS